MAQRHQRGWLKKEMRAEGETWVLFFRTTRKSDGKRVENKVRIGLVKDLPNKASAWAEVDRLHLYLNPMNLITTNIGMKLQPLVRIHGVRVDEAGQLRYCVAESIWSPGLTLDDWISSAF